MNILYKIIRTSSKKEILYSGNENNKEKIKANAIEDFFKIIANNNETVTLLEGDKVLKSKVARII